jgi:DNA-binding NarL/FixJ family response regulator
MYGFREFLTTDVVEGQIIQSYLNEPKVAVAEIARRHQKTEAEVYRILHANDISPNRLKANHQKVHHLASLGWGIHDIAEFTGYSTRNVRYILSKPLNEG